MVNKEQTNKDIEKLKDLYILLKEVMVELYEIESRHPKAHHFREVMEKTLLELNEVDHLLIQEAYTLKKEEKDAS